MLLLLMVVFVRRAISGGLLLLHFLANIVKRLSLIVLNRARAIEYSMMCCTKYVMFSEDQSIDPQNRKIAM